MSEKEGDVYRMSNVKLKKYQRQVRLVLLNSDTIFADRVWPACRKLNVRMAIGTLLHCLWLQHLLVIHSW